MSEKKVIRIDHGQAMDIVKEMKVRQQTFQTAQDLLTQQYAQNHAELEAYMKEQGKVLGQLHGIAEGTMIEIDTRYLADFDLAFLHIGGVQDGGLVKH